MRTQIRFQNRLLIGLLIKERIELSISVDVVKEHVMSLYQKIGANNRSEAVAIALRKQLLKM